MGDVRVETPVFVLETDPFSHAIFVLADMSQASLATACHVSMPEGKR